MTTNTATTASTTTATTTSTTAWRAAAALAAAYGHGWAHEIPADENVRRDLEKVLEGGSAELFSFFWEEREYVNDGVRSTGLVDRIPETRLPETEDEAQLAYALHCAWACHFGGGMTGLSPSLEHESGSGRIRWSIDDRKTVVEIHRPDPSGREGESFCCLRAVVHHGSDKVRVQSFSQELRYVRIFSDGSGSRPEVVQFGPEARHWTELDRALGALGFER
jgi:hypothetical protein